MKQWAKRVCSAMLAMACLCTVAFGAAQYDAVNPSDPYQPPVSGMFHEQKIDVDGISGQYSVYIPSSFEPCTDGVMVLVPDGTTAKQFVEAGGGKAWKALSDKLGIASVYVEPKDGEAWNVACSPAGRDDEAFLKKVYDTIRGKARTTDAAFDLDERAFYLIGYGAGGTAAHKAAMAWPTIFCGVASVGGSAVQDSVIAKLGDAASYPFAQADSLQGREENNLKNKDIPVPVWIIEGASKEANSASVEKYWAAANGAETAAANNWAQRTYVNPQKNQQRVWITTAENAAKINEEALYQEFLSKVQRFVGDPGSRLEWTIAHENKDGKGFFTTETQVDGFVRRWMTYVPSSYQKGKEMPLVVAMHGYSSAMTAFTGDSRWQDVAEKNGFLVVFPQAFPVNGGYGGGNIPVPYWSNYSGPSYEEAPDDIAFLKTLLETTEKDYSVDASRIYATGHSNGSAQTWALALDMPEPFAAVAPVGYTNGSYKEGAGRLDVPLPIWTFKGQYDINFADTFGGEGNTNDLCLAQWTERNGLNPASLATTKDATGRYVTDTYTNGTDNAPLFRFTSVKNSPHAYLPAQAEMIWSDFFSKYTLGTDGKRYYEGKAISGTKAGAATDTPAPSAFADTATHWAKDAIADVVQKGWFTGTSSTAFSPDAPVTRGMTVTVLGRYANADATAKATFDDVPQDAYYSGYVAWAASKGIAGGTSEKTFAPETNITREQLAVMLKNLASVPMPADADDMALREFSDYGDISDWAVEGMGYCYAAKLITGKGDTLDPQGLLTRAELATILSRMAK